MWKFVVLLLVVGCVAAAEAGEDRKVNTSSGDEVTYTPNGETLEAPKEVRRKNYQINSPNQWKPLKKSKYLSYLFRKYGSGGLITFEGLEHMMHNLGLGGLDFNPDHTIEEHHPEGYKIYDDDNNEKSTEEKVIDSGHFTEVQFKTTTDKSHNEIYKIKIQSSDEEGDEEIVVVKEVHSRPETNKGDEDVVYKSPEHNFKEMHDPKHRHPRFYDHHNGGMSCLSPSAMSRLLVQHKGYLYKVDREKRHVSYYHYDDADDLGDMDVNDLAITPVEFIDILCPALLSQIERGDCVMKRKSSGTEGITSEKKLFQFAWLYATISILIISMCGLIGVAIVPLTKSSSYDYILRFLVAVAIGTLAGDALMHLLPHALTPHLDHGDDTIPEDNKTGHKNDEPVFLCAFAFLAAVLMYILETMLPLLYQMAGHNHSHHSHAHNDRVHPRGRRSSSIIQEEMTLEPGHPFKRVEGDNEPELNMPSMTQDDIIKKPTDMQLSPIAFMVIIGDGLHNITDGLAIGAAFAFDPITGMATALAVLCHELPHELGDFALLLKTGVSIKRALILNLISSVLSLIGMAFGLIVAGIHTSMVRWIYAATAGTFLYIAMADLIPEMSREPEGKTLRATICQVTGILLGGLIMLTIALNEDRLRILFE